MGRIDELCAYLLPCGTFADVGCDHGYCTQFMLEHDLCERAILSDISAKSLAKAEKLLAPYVASGRVQAVVCFGLDNIPRDTDEVLIAGMGGEEILAILKRGFIPKRFVLQPMKNADLVRAYLLQNGCTIERDDLFFDGKFYFAISGTSPHKEAEGTQAQKGSGLDYKETQAKHKGSGQTYTQTQLRFGRDSLANPLFQDYLAQKIAKKRGYLQAEMSGEHRAAIVAELDYLKRVKDGEIT
jgi:tRNA A22 N-methylase